MIEEPETDCHWVSDASDWSSIKSGEIWNLRLCLEKCQSEEVYDQAASAAGSNGNDGNYGISCLLRGDSSILQRSRLRTRKSSWHWGGGDRSQSLFLYIPQEKNITVKLVRLGGERSRWEDSNYLTIDKRWKAIFARFLTFERRHIEVWQNWPTLCALQLVTFIIQAGFVDDIGGIDVGRWLLDFHSVTNCIPSRTPKASLVWLMLCPKYRNKY